MKTAEELRQEALQLQEQAQRLEREAAQKKRDEEIKQRRELENKIYAALAEKIVTALRAAGQPAKVEVTQAPSWNAGQSYVEVTGQGHRLVKVDVNRSRYEPYRVVGVSVTVGSYGEKPHTWEANDVDSLKTDGIVKAVKDRLANRWAEAKRREEQNAAYAKADAIEKGNKGLTDQVVKPEGEYVYLRPSRRNAGHVTFKFEREFDVTPGRASEILAILHQLR